MSLEEWIAECPHISGVLTERESRIYFLHNVEEYGFTKIGEAEGITRERVRQIYRKALAKLGRRLQEAEEWSRKYYKAVSEITYLQTSLAETTYKLAQVSEIAARLGIMFGWKEPPENKPESQPAKPRQETIGIEEIGLSVRSYNCLMRHGVQTVGDILKLSGRSELKNIRNLGFKSMDEVLLKMKELGYNATAYGWEPIDSEA